MTITAQRGSELQRRFIASPRARRALAQHRVDAGALQGRGPGGRILEADVLRYAANQTPTPPHAAAGVPEVAWPEVAWPAVACNRAPVKAAQLGGLQKKFQP